jgi:aspartyl-tRNA(Asn)/glutamyl-tRNA(Gln) amidotransferase subunit A
MGIERMSRRAFVKGVLAGGAGGALPQIAIGADAAGGATPPITDTGPSALCLSEASRLVRQKKISPVELTQACLERIDSLNPTLNAFITVTAESALTAARSAETQIARGGWKGPLHGIPIAVKDLLDTAGIRTTAGSALFKDRVPAEDAEVVRRLRAAGAVLLGKLNMHEFAFGGSSAISYFGAVRNPWDVAYSPGGSSGGSAAAVAAGLCYAALGSDTGGSIREPAAYCGIVGLKPTYGRVSTSGAIPLSWSLDHIGPMTRTVSDAALVLQVIAGYDSQDPGSVDLPVPECVADIAASTSGLRLGILRDYFYESLSPDIEAAMQNALSVLKSLTRSVHEVAPLATDATYASVMNPYVAVLSAEAYEFHKEYIAKSPELYQAPTLKRLRAGADVTISTYVQSRRQLEQIRNAIARRFDDVDFVITPTTPVPPFTLAELSDANKARPMELQMLHNTRPINMLGLPTISVPCGFTVARLPIGLQISGRPGAEASVLRLAHAYERAAGWRKITPSIHSPSA